MAKMPYCQDKTTIYFCWKYGIMKVAKSIKYFLLGLMSLSLIIPDAFLLW